MRVLLDTCAVSELRRAKPHSGVVRIIESLDSADLYLSVVTIGEISKGIALLSDARHRRDLQLWLQNLERTYAEQVLDVDRDTAHLWGELTAAAQKKGRVIPASDGLIAATARRHGLTVLTRNTADFEPAGVLVLNPWR